MLMSSRRNLFRTVRSSENFNPGPNSAVVINNGEDDAMVKFRSPDGVVTVALFVVGQSQAIIEDFPDGSFISNSRQDSIGVGNAVYLNRE